MQTQIKDIAGGLASFGRYGDTYMVHAAEGETVIPAEILQANPKLKQDLFRQMQMMGIENPNRYIVGSSLNSINPVTGQPEFFFKKILKFAEKAAPAIIGAVADDPRIGAAIGATIGGIDGGLKGALKGGATGYFGGRALRGGVEGAGFNLPGTGINTPPSGLTFGERFKGAVTGGLQGLSEAAKFGFGQRPTSASSNTQTNLASGIYDPANPAAGILANSSTKSAPQKKNFLSKTLDFLGSDTGQAIGSIASATIPAFLGYKAAKDFEEKQKDPEELKRRQRAIDPETTAGRDYFRMSLPERASAEGQDLQREAAITQSMSVEDLMRTMGLTQQEAMNYLQSAYPGQTAFAGGGEIIGPGTGTSDSINAKLSDGEYVFTAKAVRGAGNGNRDLGAARMYDIMSRFEGMA